MNDFKKALIYRAEKQIQRELFRAGSPLRTMVLAAPLQDGGERERETYDNHVRAVSRVLCLLMAHMDIVSLVVGQGHDGHHHGHLVRKMPAKLPGISQRTIERALRTIHALGWIRTKTRHEKTAEGLHIGLPAVRFFSEPFFALIGLGKRLARRRAKEYAARKEASELRIDRQAERAGAMHTLQALGRQFLASRPVRAVAAAGAMFRPPDPEPAV